MRPARSPPALVLAAALPLLGGCVVAQPYPVYSYGYGYPAPVGPNTATGAAVGAAAGGLLGAAAANPWNRGSAALGGAAAGALVGGLVGAAADADNARAAEAQAYGYVPPSDPAYAGQPYGYAPAQPLPEGYAQPYAPYGYRY